MSKSNRPSLFQGYLTSLDKKVVQPAKMVLKSDIVKQNITRPAMKLANEQPFIKEYITDPLVNASNGKTASDLKRVANGAKEGIKYLSKPLLSQGLKEEDVENDAEDGYVYAPTHVEGETRIVEARKQGTSMAQWEDETWSEDEDSHFKAKSQPDAEIFVAEFKDENGQIHMSVIDDITDVLYSEEDKTNDVTFRDSETLDISDLEKVEAKEMEAEQDVEFRAQNIVFGRKVNAFDIAKIEEARADGRRGILAQFDPLYQCARVAERLDPWSSAQRERKEEATYFGNQRRLNDSGTSSEAENVRYSNWLMNQSISQLVHRPIPSPPQDRSSSFLGYDFDEDTSFIKDSGDEIPQAIPSPPQSRSRTPLDYHSDDESSSDDEFEDAKSRIDEDHEEACAVEQKKDKPQEPLSDMFGEMCASAEDFLASSLPRDPSLLDQQERGVVEKNSCEVDGAEEKHKEKGQCAQAKDGGCVKRSEVMFGGMSASAENFLASSTPCGSSLVNENQLRG